MPMSTLVSDSHQIDMLCDELETVVPKPDGRVFVCSGEYGRLVFIVQCHDTTVFFF